MARNQTTNNGETPKHPNTQIPSRNEVILGNWVFGCLDIFNIFQYCKQVNSRSAASPMQEIHAALSEFTVKCGAFILGSSQLRRFAATLRGADEALPFPAADHFFRRYSEGRQPIHLVKAFENTNGLW